MKKNRKLHLEKLNSIVQTDYVVLDLITYNQMVRYNTICSNRSNQLYEIIYDSKLTNTQKYNKIKEILLNGGRL